MFYALRLIIGTMLHKALRSIALFAAIERVSICLDRFEAPDRYEVFCATHC